MKAIVLVGGLGTRLRPLTFAVPKPLLAIGEKPILELLIGHLCRAQVREIILATGYLSELIETFCGDGSRFGVEITYVKEPQRLGTAGPLSLLRDRIADDEFVILLNGDIVTQLDLRDFVAFSRQSDYELTVAYVHHTYQSPFGVLSIENHQVVGITEKPEVRSCVSSGIYCLKGSALNYIPDGQYFSIPELIDKMRSCNRPIGAYPIREFWMSIEHLEDIDTAVRTLNGPPAASSSGSLPESSAGDVDPTGAGADL